MALGCGVTWNSKSAVTKRFVWQLTAARQTAMSTDALENHFLAIVDIYTSLGGLADARAIEIVPRIV